MAVVVLGAGITGMATAYKLADSDVNTTIIEKDPRIGGLAGSIIKSGGIFDFGAHAFVLDEKMKKDFYQIIPERELNIFQKDVKIKFGRKYYQYPLDGINILLNLNPAVTALCFCNYVISKLKMIFNTPFDDSAEAWIINRFGKTLYKIYFEKYTEKVWGLHPRLISPSFIAEGIPLLNLRETIKNTVNEAATLILNRPKPAKPSYDTQLYYPKRGLLFFFEQLANKVSSNKGTIFLNSQITNVHLDGCAVKAISIKTDGRIETIGTDYVVSTIPLNELIKLITPEPDNGILKTAILLKFRALIFVNLIIKKTEVFDTQWIYFRNSIFNRVAEVNKFSKELFAEGLTGLCAEITCEKDDEIWNSDENKLVNRVVKELEQEGFIKRSDVKDACIVRKEHGYPVADLNYKESQKILFNYIGGIENLFVTGRQGLFRYLQMDQCLKMGFTVAKHILSGKSKNNYSTYPKEYYFV